MVNDNWSAVSLCVNSRVRSAESISEFLNLVPTTVFDRGARYSSRNLNSRMREETVWVHRISSGGDLHDKLVAVAELIEDRRVQLSGLRNDCDVALAIGFSSSSGQGGFMMDARLVGVLGEFGMGLWVDLFPPGEEAES